jgi:hypothetical protein
VALEENLRGNFFGTRDYVGSYVEYDITVTCPQRGSHKTLPNANENGTKTLLLLHANHLLFLVSSAMATKDLNTDSCGGLKGSILSKSCVCPRSCNFEGAHFYHCQGIFTTIVECAEE